MTLNDPTASAGDDFLARVDSSLAGGRFVKLVLAKPRAGGDLLRVTVRRVELRGEEQLSFVSTHKTRDVTKNLPLAEGVAQLRERLTTEFGHAHLMTTNEDAQLMVSKKGQQTLRVSAAAHDEAEPASHDRAKKRFVAQQAPFLAALGVTTEQHQVVPAMARKWKQINKFVEVFAHALDASPLASAKEVRVADFGAGKGYLTFAIHDHLRQRGVAPKVTGVELRPDLVDLCNGVIDRLALDGLRFEAGDLRSHTPERLDVMIALHACDTATDHAIHLGLAAGASVILCSPCCHKQIRPQLLSPHPLRPILQHGVHLGQEAEMLTDGLRALLLEASGYDTQVFEFVALEHTNKNKMILAVKRDAPRDNAEVLKQIAEIKSFYGIREHALEGLLAADGRL
jgi:protein-L-isoaspartate O-methyltransferase